MNNRFYARQNDFYQVCLQLQCLVTILPTIPAFAATGATYSYEWI